MPGRIRVLVAGTLIAVALAACAGRSGDAAAVASPAATPRVVEREAVPLAAPAAAPAIAVITDGDRRPLPEIETGRADALGVRQRVSLVERAGGRWPLVRVEEDLAADGTVRARREMVGDHVMVSARPGTTAAAVAALAARHGCAVRERIRGTDVWLLSFPVADHRAFPAAIAALAGEPGLVAVAEPDWIVSATVTPGDPLYGQLWGLDNSGQSGGVADADIDAPEAWDIATGSRSVVVGVIDTGIDASHPDLAANMWTNPGESGTDANGLDKKTNGIDDDANGYVDDWRGWDFVANDNNPADEHYHGTHCAGTIGGLGGNGVGVTGVCWQVSLVGLRFLNAQGSGTTSAAIAAVAYATTLHLDLTSNSWGGGGFSQALKDAIDAAGAQGIAFVAAAGNNASNTDSVLNYPSCYDSANIISVAATTRTDGLASFSNYGATTVDLGAPGQDILSCQPGGGYQLLSGTSMATPHVAGAYALLKSVSPSITVAQAKAALLANTDPIPALAGKAVAGRLNLRRAVEAVAGPVLQIQAFQLVEQGDGDGWISPGESAQLRWKVGNIGTESAAGVARTVTCPDGRVSVTGGSAVVPTLAPGESAWIEGVTAQPVADATMPISTTVQLALTLAVPARAWSDVRPFAVARVGTVAGIVRQQSDDSPIGGATVAWTGAAAGTLTTGAGGLFSKHLPEGTYSVVASAPGHLPSAAQTVVLPPDANLVLALPVAPDLQISPSSLAISVPQGGAATAALHLANAGGAELTWSSVDASASTTGLWHRSAYRDSDTGGSWYYGQESTRNYDTGAANAGDLVFESVSVPAGNPLLTFREWRQAEAGSAYDRSTVEIASGGGSWMVVRQSTWNGAAWQMTGVSLAQWAGSTVRLRFRFDTVDGIANSYEGWYLDDIRVGGSPLAGGLLQIAPTSGSLAAGAGIDAVVTATAGSRTAGVYPAMLRIASNDPDQATTDVPVSVTVTPSPVMVFASRSFVDGSVPPAAGDGDGFAEPGETLGLLVQVRNAGSLASTALSGTLACATTGVTIPDPTYPLAAVAAGATAFGPQRGVVIGSAIADGAILPFTLALGDGTRTWNLSFTVLVDRRIRVTGVVATEPANAVLANAQVAIAGLSAVSGATGSYAISGVKPGSLAASASASGYLTATASLTLDADGTWDPVLGSRRLSISPLLIDRTIIVGADDTAGLTLGATGTRPVAFSIAVPAYPGEGGTPWLAVSPIAGTIDAGAQSVLAVTGTSASLASGVYERTIVVTSDDTVSPSTTVTYRLHVQSAHAPVAEPITVTTDEDIPIDIPLIATDEDGDPLAFAIVEGPWIGQATIDGAILHYVPPAETSGTEVIQVVASDGMRTSDPAAIVIMISPVNDPPLIAATSVRAGRDVATRLHLSAQDPEGEPLTWSIQQPPAHGTVSGTGPNFIYKPRPGYLGEDAFTACATDAGGQYADRIVPIVVEAQVDQWTTFGNGVSRTGFAAVGLPPKITTTPAWTATFDHQLNQVAVGDGLVHVTPFKYAYGSVWAAAHDLGTGGEAWYKELPGGGAEVDAPTWDDGQVFFQRDNHESDSQLYAVDASSGTSIWTAPFQCQWDNHFAPLALPGKVYVNGGIYGGMYGFERATGAQSFFLPGPQVDLWSPSWYDGVVYRYVGTDLRAHDPVTGEVLWSVAVAGSIYTYSMNRVVVLADGLAVVIGADSAAQLTAVDLATHAIRWSVAGPFVGNPAVANGRVFAGSAAGIRSFDLASGASLETYSGAGAFTGQQPIVTTDGLLGRCGETTAIWRIGKTTPVAVIPAGGHLSLAGTTLLVAENTGDAIAETGTLRAYRLGDHPPVASSSSAAGSEDEALSGQVPASDPDGDALSTSLAKAPAHGMVVLDGLSWTYTPVADWNGTDAFKVLVSDGTLSVTATVTVILAAVGDPPVAADSTASGPEDVNLVGALPATDADGDALTATIDQPPVHGTVAFSGLTWAYVPEPDWNGSDAFTVLVSDGTSSVPAQVQLTIAPVNDLPVAAPLIVSTPANTAILMSPGAYDKEGDAVTWQLVRLPAHGVATIDGDYLRYSPSVNWTGKDTFTYAAVDGVGFGTPAKVTVTVRAEGLPVPWTDIPIGITPGKPSGGTAYDWTARTFVVGGYGKLILGFQDQFRSVHQWVSGDVMIKARLLSQEGGDGGAKAGLMIRDGSAVDARNVFLCQTPANGISLQYRATTGGTTTRVLLPSSTGPWLRLRRLGNVFTAWTSPDGVIWGGAAATITVEMGLHVEVGMAVNSHVANTLSTAQFSGVKVTLLDAPAAVRGIGFVPAGVPVASLEPAGR